MKYSLREYVDLVVEDSLDERLRGGFDLNQFKRLKTPEERSAYAKEHLTLKLGEGSSRDAWALSTGKVLKTIIPDEEMAFSIDQCKNEYAAFEKYGAEYIPRVYDRAPDFTWLIVEPVRAFSMITFSSGVLPEKCGFNEWALREFGRFFNRGIVKDNNPEIIWNKCMDNDLNKRIIEHPNEEAKPLAPYYNELPAMGQELLQKFIFLSKHGMIDIGRTDHWGWTADGRVVCLDPGVTK